VIIPPEFQPPHQGAASGGEGAGAGGIGTDANNARDDPQQASQRHHGLLFSQRRSLAQQSAAGRRAYAAVVQPRSVRSRFLHRAGGVMPWCFLESFPSLLAAIAM